ncbi:hypothetical protein MLD38_021859 [Melastoma candidum]|uniref:Uncharacterized protein n=1 Tax=Melastoma candidum TaxID=119954 RepID=A0ACB9QHC0_9MYRT|nr:hypothetical protein MLD38_021859 [Melastoma candidum]
MNLAHSVLLTDDVGDGAAIAEPPVRKAVAEIDPVPREAGLGKALGQLVVVSDVGEGVTEDELNDLGVGSPDGPYQDCYHHHQQQQHQLPHSWPNSLINKIGVGGIRGGI